MSTTAAPARERTAYRVRAESVEACSCRHGCNCQFGGVPNEGICEFVIGYQVVDGHFGDVDLDGVRAVVVAKYPNAIHQGHGDVVLFIDESATPEQTSALATILSGQVGGMPWEALAGTIEHFDGPVRAAIDFDVHGQDGHVRIPGVVDVETTPLRDAVSGEPKEVHITYPRGGFFWNDGNIVTTSAMHARHGDIDISWPDKYAAIAEVNWTNETS